MKASQYKHKQNKNSKKINDSLKYEDVHSKSKKSFPKRNSFNKSLLPKRPKVLNNLRASLKNYFCLLVMISLLCFINSQRSLDDDLTNSISLKFNKTGLVKIISNFQTEPTKIYINGEQNVYTNMVTINALNDIVKIEWNVHLTSCNEMFKDLPDVTEIDFTNFYSSSVTVTSSMFYNCISLTSINFNNFITSSVTKMDSMFYLTK